MYAGKFTIFYVIATLAALASASPVPVPVPVPAIDARTINVPVVAREPLPPAMEDLAERSGCYQHNEGVSGCT